MAVRSYPACTVPRPTQALIDHQRIAANLPMVFRLRVACYLLLWCGIGSFHVRTESSKRGSSRLTTSGSKCGLLVCPSHRPANTTQSGGALDRGQPVGSNLMVPGGTHPVVFLASKWMAVVLVGSQRSIGSPQTRLRRARSDCISGFD
jgi:hypothetical protein